MSLPGTRSPRFFLFAVHSVQPAFGHDQDEREDRQADPYRKTQLRCPEGAGKIYGLREIVREKAGQPFRCIQHHQRQYAGKCHGRDEREDLALGEAREHRAIEERAQDADQTGQLIR